MRVSEVRISGFRSIPCVATPHFEKGKVSRVEWADPGFRFEMRQDDRGHDITGLIGPNSAGKSNALRAIQLFFYSLDSQESTRPDCATDYHQYTPPADPEEFREAREPYIVVEILFDALSESEQTELAEYCLCVPDEKASRLQVGIVWDVQGKQNIYCRRDPASADVEYLGASLTHAQVKRIAAVMPRFYWLPTGEDITRELQARGGKYLKRLVDDVLGDVRIIETLPQDALTQEQIRLRQQIISTKQQLEKLRRELDALKNLPSPFSALSESLVSYMAPIIGGISVWFEFSSNLPTDFWQWLDVTTVRFDDGWSSNLSEKGHGAQRTFAIALLRAYADFRIRDGGNHPLLVAIEEPEIYMHPHITRVVSSVLMSLSRSGQVLFTTHAPTLVEPLDWENLALVRSRGPVSTVKQMARRTLSTADKVRIQRSLDAAECEMFFAQHVLLVEGPTERFAWPGMIRTLKASQHPLNRDLDELGVSVIDVGGKTRFAPFIQLLNAFEIPWAVQADYDALSSVTSQLHEAGLVTRGDLDGLNALGDDFEARRARLRAWNCYVLTDDFEGVIARALDEARIWELVNEARARQEKPPRDFAPFPGQKNRQTDWLVDSWKHDMRRALSGDILHEYREGYQPHIEEMLGQLDADLYALAEDVIRQNHWITDTENKWFARALAREGKPIVGMVVGEKLTADEVLCIEEFNEIVDYFVELQARMLKPARQRGEPAS